MGTRDADETREGVQVAIFIGFSALMILIFQKKVQLFIFVVHVHVCTLYFFGVFTPIL